jgi:hypothetical protein
MKIDPVLACQAVGGEGEGVLTVAIPSSCTGT